MRLPTALAWGALLFTSSLSHADADFQHSRRRKDMSGHPGDPPEKYFHESEFHAHYDGRFTDHVLEEKEQIQALKILVQSYLTTFSNIGVETWLMHGSLLGWWWNKQIMPWDTDIDVQVTEPSMYFLAAYYNMSIFHYKVPRRRESREYMLEVNPNYVNRDESDKFNTIDARWIDTQNGLFIDITTARYDLNHPEGTGVLTCKDGHQYRDTYIFPLRDTVFEGSPVKVPYRYKDLLEAEYGTWALSNTVFNEHIFDVEKKEWLPKSYYQDL